MLESKEFIKEINDVSLVGAIVIGAVCLVGLKVSKKIRMKKEAKRIENDEYLDKIQRRLKEEDLEKLLHENCGHLPLLERKDYLIGEKLK